ncbi:MAG TPA: hypothetical protein VGZ29_05600 [Terriglobia bacterium]|nr:hypothetical protein [Terriglobia bacterium]
MNNKLLAARATRVEEEVADELAKISDHDGLKPAEVDRQILTWFAATIARRRRPGQALKQFLRSLVVVENAA